MARPLEVGIYTDLNGDNNCLKVFDLGSGVELRSFKEGNAGRHCVSLEHPNYVICGLQGKQLIYFWDKWKEQVGKKIVCPGKVSALAVSPDGHYCIVGLVEKLYVWQVPTGNLMAVLSKHYQTVSCLKFLDTGSHFLSGGDDGLVVAWDLASTLVQWTSGGCDQSLNPALHMWSHHSLPISDIWTGIGGIRCRVLTASIDHTCKLYDFASGRLLCSIVFGGGITAMAMDSAELCLFAGLITGSIESTTLYKSSLKKDVYVNAEESDERTCFRGHSKQVSSLSVTLDGCTLLSGSMDCTCRLWHVESKQCLKVINCKGAVTNVMVVKAPYQIWGPPPSNKVLAPVGNFKRTLYSARGKGGAVARDEDRASDSEVQVILKNLELEAVLSCSHSVGAGSGEEEEDRELFSAIIREFSGSGTSKGDSKTSLSRAELEQKVHSLEISNQNLRNFISTRLLERLATEENSMEDEQAA